MKGEDVSFGHYCIYCTHIHMIYYLYNRLIINTAKTNTFVLMIHETPEKPPFMFASSIKTTLAKIFN